MSRRMFLGVVALGVISMVGCVSLPREAQVEVENYKRAMSSLTSQGIEIAKQIEAMKCEIQEAKDAEKVQIVSAKLLDAVEESRAIALQMAAAQEAIKKLSETYGVPWWQITGEGLIAVLTTLAGVGGVGAAGLARYKQVQTQKVAEEDKLKSNEALTTLVKAIETGKKQAKIKKVVAAAGNEIVEGIVKSVT